MAQLAIKGHPTRGSEIIALLEMLGGNNKYHINIIECHLLYTIREGDNAIICTYPNRSISQIYTLEEFLEKFPYKVGDKVIYHECESIVSSMKWDVDEVVYKVNYKGQDWQTTVFYLQPYNELKEEIMEDKCTYDKLDFEQEPCADKVELILGDNYEIKVEDGKTYVVKKQHKYPKTYEECCKVLLLNPEKATYSVCGLEYKRHLIVNFQRLLICRDAYWKIAGEQMGLGKPWEPDWDENNGGYRYCIRNQSNKIVLSNEWLGENYILSFHTKEMCDTFYENFKELIENCKELL